MTESLVRIGEPQPRYTARGNLSSFSLELWHDGLNEHREVKSSDPGVLENKANAILAKWEEKWIAKQLKLASIASAESTALESQDALAALEECATLLAATLNVDDRIDWNQLKKSAPFQWNPDRKPFIKYKRDSNQPTSFESVDLPKPPNRNDYLPIRRWYHSFMTAARAKEEERVRIQYESALHAYQDALARAESENQARQRALQSELDAYEQDAERHRTMCLATAARVEEFRAEWLQKSHDAVLEHADLVLANSSYPAWIKSDYKIAYQADTGLFVVDFELPAPGDLPTLEKVTYVKSRDERIEKHIPESRAKKLYDSVCYQIALRTIHELYEADSVDALRSITFNGWVTAINKATGRSERSCILSVQSLKEEFLTFDLSRVDPKECFKALKGVAASSLAGLAPVRPILRLTSDDPRFVSSKPVAEHLDESVNLASMPWEDFEHLVRELFAKIFSAPGAEVHVTQASRDGGVDAIALDPDPIKGGKVVIQAKRYTGTVGVSAVRDLYGTVMNEGANRGILVTTSNYGPDAYRFAQGKPLTLLSGGNLLALLSEHGHSARIDIAEARQHLAESRPR